MVQSPLWSGKTDVGLKRQGNEDAYRGDAAQGLWVVADGMGGYSHGDFASREVVTQLVRQTYSGQSPEDAITERVASAHAAILKQREAKWGSRIGATVVVLAVGHGKAILAHLGDSRIYRLRGGKLQQLTKDHTPVQEVLDRELGLSPEEIDNLHRRFGNLVNRAVGLDNEYAPTFHTVPLEPDDVFLLCSDGLTGMVADDDIESILNQTPKLMDAVDRLVEAANANGGKDNITAVLVKVPDPNWAGTLMGGEGPSWMDETPAEV